MEYNLSCKGSALPCEVTLDEDNGRYMLRNADSTGQYFNTPQQLVEWIQANWRSSDFINPDEFTKMMQEMKNHLNI
ncbi:hypothetical protein [Calidifontibacillus oryziterrae]|uniref:hypothetical protein n=1 Tax=Calidifontibacillus oryziterrae TaxID=1191699 RepID=UPI00031E78BC|nr:hypothetical protein [Calidifontibacillus oryziterrae]